MAEILFAARAYLSCLHINYNIIFIKSQILNFWFFITEEFNKAGA